MRVGLVLEGGGMRALYTAGILDALMDEDITIDGVVAVSAGALFGVNFLSGQKGRALRYNKTYIKNKHYMGLRSWLRTGNVVNKEMAYYTIPMELDKFDNESFKQSGVPFYAVATDIEVGKPDYILIEDVFEQMEALRASSALPLASEIVTYNGKKYLDGGLSDSIPVDFARSLGFDKLIVVLTQPVDYRKKSSSGNLYKFFYRHYPNFVKMASKRYQHYNEAVEKIINLEKQGEVFVIRPETKLKIGRLEKNLDKFDEIYELGLRDALTHLSKLQNYLKN